MGLLILESISAHKPGQDLLAHYRDVILLVLLIILASVFQLIWIAQDTRPHPFTDPYPNQILEFVDLLLAGGTHSFQQLLTVLSTQGRPPLYGLLSVPFVLLFGRSVDSMLLVNVGFMVLLLISVYGLGLTVKDRRVGLLAAFLCATYPTIVNLSHISRPNFAETACVALSLWLLFALVRSRSKPIAWLFGLSLGFGVLIRHFFVFHLALPSLVLGFYLLLFQTTPRWPTGLRQLPAWLLDKLRDPFVRYGLLPGLLIAAAMTASWYLSEMGEPFWQLTTAVQKLPPVIRGFGSIADYSFWWYAQTATGAMSNVFVVLFIIGLVMALLNRRLLSLTLVFVVIASYTILSLQKGLGWHRFASVLPVVAVITALWIVELQCNWLRRLLIAVCMIVGSFNYSVVMWGVQPWSRPIAILLGSPLASVTHKVGHSDAATWTKTLDEDTCSWRVNAVFCPEPARNEDWRLSDIAETILRDGSCAKGQCRVLVVSENENFNIAVLGYQVIQDFPLSRYSLRYLRASPWPWSRHYQRDWMMMDYILYISEWSNHRVGHALTQFLESPPEEFRGIFEPVESFSLPTGWTARLVRRTQEVSAKQAERIIASLDLPE